MAAKLDQPYISASKKLPELTLKSIILGVILAALLSGSNAYLALKIGQTVTACIPAAIMSMAILGMFKNSNILENNMVQTIASAGEVIAASAIFTLPALLVIGHWDSFPILETSLITIVGGFIGIFFSIPLRRALIIEERLAFPEGVATAEVLKAGDQKSGSAKNIIIGGALAALMQLCQGAFQFAAHSLAFWKKVGSSIIGFNIGFSPVMIGAGYIVGHRVGITLLVGGIVMNWVLIPAFTFFDGIPQAVDFAKSAALMKSNLRYVGVGTMIVGGIAAFISVLKPIRVAIGHSFKSFGAGKSADKLPRTEQDIPFSFVLIGLLVLFVPVYIILNHVFQSFNLPLSSATFFTLVLVSVISTYIVGFLVASISGYMSGLVGTSSNPLSGSLIASIILVALVVTTVIGGEINYAENVVAATGVAAGLIMITAMVAAMGVISCDNLQDLKSGHVLGSTPWKQELALFLGVVVSAFAIAPIMQILFEAYGIAGVFPRLGMNPDQNLAAPQSVLLATIAQGMLGQSLPFNLIMIGVGIGVVAIVIDQYLKRTGKGRFPALGVALGLYLPFEIVTALFLGGILKYIVTKTQKNKNGDSQGLLFASGLIAGEAIIGILLAIPFAASQRTDLFQYTPAWLMPYSTLIGFALFAYIAYKLVRAGQGTAVKK